MLKIGNICKFQSGGTPSKKNPEYYNGNIPWITTVSLIDNYIDENNAVEYITSEAIKNSAAKIVPKDSIMIGTRVGIGKTAINCVEMSTSQDIVSLIDIDENRWNKCFLCLFFKSKRKYLLSQSRGATIKGIKIDTISNLELPTYSIDEQKEIVSTLDTLQSIITHRRTQLEKLDLLVKARFVEMFGDPQKNTQSRPTTELINVVKMQRGFDLPTYSRNQNGNVPVYGANGALDKHDTAKVFGGGVITGRSGTIGNVYYTSDDYWPLNTSLFSSDLHGNNVIYLAYLLDMFDLTRFKEGTGVPTLNRNKFHKEQIIDVPIIQQTQFADFVKKVDKSKATVQKALDEAQLLFDSLMQEYFG